jgi:Ca-activated chloride channel family protein
VYRTSFNFPDIDTENPEIERLWALSQIEQIENQSNTGALANSEARDMIRELGLGYQLVTDETSMVVLSDESFEQHGIERRNRQRVGLERVAQATRSKTAPVSYVVDHGRPLTSGSAPTHRSPNAGNTGGGGGGGGFNGGGALSPMAVIAMVTMVLAALLSLRADRARVE